MCSENVSCRVDFDVDVGHFPLTPILPTNLFCRRCTWPPNLSRDVVSAGCLLPGDHEEGWVVVGVDVVALSATIHAKVSKTNRRFFTI